MVLDFSLPFVSVGPVVFPDYPFQAVPVQPNQIGETVVLKGSNTGVNLNLSATADQSE